METVVSLAKAKEKELGARAALSLVKVSVGRDDMNLAEFPLASLDDRVPKDQKTLVFEDQITSKGAPVTRRLTISASDKFGLPTALDDEVILGLVQLTKLKGFSERRVEFTRYQLIQILGWREEGKSYQRIDESLKRWLGVSLYYDKAWWDNEEKSWVNESFHVLDNVTLYDRERYERRRKAGGPEAGMSSFVWNEIVFRSFQAGYLKRLDLELYRTFQSAVTKRLYRFADKHFHKKRRWEFDLHTLCFDKLGMTRTEHTGEMKRRLNVGIRELEEHGVFRKMAETERFVKTGPGKWTVVIEKADERGEQETEPAPQGITLELMKRGLSPETAREFVEQHSAEVIADRIALHDWLLERGDKRISKRPAGFLAQSIRKKYPLPEDYVAELRRGQTVQVAQRPQGPLNAAEPAAAVPDPDRERCLAYFGTLSAADQVAIESEALAGASRVHEESYARLKAAKGPLFEEIRERIIVSYLRTQDLQVGNL
ncbi:MAG: replication initiator protein A [Pirellulales bacterium]|nr:replication initiator protein A [Pirellulales bacterium]